MRIKLMNKTSQPNQEVKNKSRTNLHIKQTNTEWKSKNKTSIDRTTTKERWCKQIKKLTIIPINQSTEQRTP
jgi:hypothetical protein